MDTLRKPLQGVRNIICFNWHFYAIAVAFIAIATVGTTLLQPPFKIIAGIAIGLTVISLFVSLFVSWYIYDRYPLYAFNWIPEAHHSCQILNIHSGLDETSRILKQKFTNATITIMDFYNPVIHTEVSIKRARKRYPPLPGTRNIQTTAIDFSSGSTDLIFLILSAHEIRDTKERILFLKELSRLLQPEGRIYIMEHLRNFENFIAYTIGFLHFYSYNNWHRTFRDGGLSVVRELNQTPFIKVFELRKNGVTT